MLCRTLVASINEKGVCFRVDLLHRDLENVELEAVCLATWNPFQNAFEVGGYEELEGKEVENEVTLIVIEMAVLKLHLITVP